MRLLIIVFALIFAIESLAASRLARPVFARVAVPEVESLGGVFAMVQDQQGFLWLGGKNGLARYDGYTVDLFRHDPANPYSLSSNDVSDLLVDRAGRLWVATLSGGGLNRFDAERQAFVRYQHRPEDPYSLGSDAVYALAEDSRGDLWLATHDDGLNRLEHATGRFHHHPLPVPGLRDKAVRAIVIDRFDTVWAATSFDGLYRMQVQGPDVAHFRHNPEDEHSLADDQLFSLYIDDYGSVWAGGLNGGLSRLDPATGRFTRYRHEPDAPVGSLGAGLVWDMAQDSAGDLWIATGNGALNRFNKWQNQFERFYPQEYANHALAGTVIRFYLDRAGDLWLGTYNSAVNRLSERGPQFQTLRHNPAEPTSLPSSTVYALAEAPDGRIWIGTERGLSQYDPAVGSMRHWQPTGEPGALPDAPIRVLAVEPQGRLWIGTAGMGAWFRDADSDTFKAVPPDVLQDQRVWAIQADGDGGVWIGTQAAGLTHYNPATNQLTHYRHDPARQDSLSHDFVWAVLLDKRGDLWVGTQVGLNRLAAGISGFQRFLYAPDQRQGLGDNSVRALAEDRNGNVWIGTPSGLNLWQAQTGGFSVLRTADGLADDNVTSVVVDDQGSVWAATQRGLARFDPISRRLRNFDSRHGVAGNAHPRKSAALRARDGTLYFAGASGVTVLNPFTVQSNLYMAPTQLTGLWVNNQRVGLGPLLPRHISLVDRLELNHRQNVFSLEFAHLSYLVPEHNRYAFQLVGFDRDWQFVGSDSRRATYTNLDPGHYRFLVKGANNDGLWNDDPVQLHIHIKPPWWRTFPAYAAYVLLLVAAAYAIAVRVQARRREERMITKRLREKDHLRAHFLSNIQERMKVPVEANVSLLDGLIYSGEVETGSRQAQSLETVRRNCQMLAQVAEELGDFAGTDQQSRMPSRALDLASVVDTTMAWFAAEANARSIGLYKTLPDNLPLVQANSVQLQQILYCLIDNALEFTREGYVEISASLTTAERPGARDQVLVQVTDTGRGMNQAELKSLWSRLERMGRRDSDLDLLRARRLVTLLGGELRVESAPQRGSTFGFTLPLAD